MANIKNFGLVGVASDVQFGKTGPRLKAESGVFAFKDAADSALTSVKVSNVVADALKSGVGQLVTVDANGQLTMGATIADLATDTELSSAISTEVTNRNTAISDAIAQEVTDRNAAITASANTLTTEINAIEAAVGLNSDGTLVAFSGDYITGQTTFAAAVDALDAAIAARATEIANEITRATNAEATKLSLSGGTMTGALILNGAAPTAANEAVSKNYVDSLAGGLSWQEPVVGLGAALPGTAAIGDRFVNTTDNKIYTATAVNTWDAGVAPADGYAVFDKSNESGHVFSGSAWVQFTGTGQIVAGLGLKKVGNRMDVELSTTGSLTFTPNETDETSVLAIKLDGTSLVSSASGLKISDTLTTEITALRTELNAEVTNRGTAVAGVQSELDATQAGAGLSAAGAYVADSSSNYLDLATSLMDADLKLDAQIKQIADAQAATVLSFTVAGDTGSDSFATGGTLTFAGSADVATVVTNDNVAFSLIDTGVAAGTYTKITVDAKGRATAGAQATTTDISEGANLYYTQARFDSAFAAKSTTDLAEGTNLYFTNARAQAALSVETVATPATDARLAYTGGVLSLVNVASIKYVDDKIAQEVIDRNNAISAAVTAGVANAARGIAKAFNGADAIIGTVKGFVHRIKVYVTAAGTTDSQIQIGRAGANGELVTTADVDSSVTGVYVIEVGQNYAADTELVAYIGGTAAGTVVVEYI